MGNSVLNENNNASVEISTDEIINFKSKLADAHCEKRVPYSGYINHGESLSKRTAALNNAAKMRAKVFKYQNKSIENKKLSSFVEYIRKQDERVLHMIFHLANLSDKKELKFNALSSEEQKLFITAINQIKALNALFPTQILMPV